MRRPRIAIYSHDALGLGHLRRNHLIATALADTPTSADVLLLSGARELNAFPLPPGVDILTLPAFRKNGDDDYVPRELSISSVELGALRSRLLRAAIEEFAPDLVIVDKVPLGLRGELLPALEQIRRRGRARCVLGLRDILDDPRVVRREWETPGVLDALHDFYDQIWVYGDRSVYDPIQQYGLPDTLAAGTHFTGYLDPRRRLVDRSHVPPWAGLADASRPYVLCELGGGQDGGRLAETFVASRLPPHLDAVLVTGPHMPLDDRARLRRAATSQPRLSVVDFLPDTSLLQSRAERVICMGGYNTLMEILVAGRPALVVPRVWPRREQYLRAERFAELGLIEFLHPDAATPQAVTAWMASPRPRPVPLHLRMDLGGLDRIPVLAAELLSMDGPRTPRAAAALAPAVARSRS